MAITTAAYAQTAPVPGAASVDELVVTATRRAEGLNSVPIAVSAMSGESLKELNLKDTFSLTTQVPNMAVTTAVGGHAVPQFNLRGVGTNDAFITATPAVGIYYDDVFVNSVFAQGMPLFDQERVEVLRGPQGTLWGKNTTAGAVNIISRTPGDELDGYARVTVGNYDYREFEGGVGGPITDTLSGRVSAFVTSREGFWTNTVNGDKVGSWRDTAFRGQLLWKPTADFTARLIATTRDEKELFYSASFGWLPGGVNFGGYRDDSRNGNVANWFASPVTDKIKVLSLNLEYKLSEDLTVTSISGYIQNKYRALGDADANPVPIFVARVDSDSKQYSQEIRLASNPNRSFRWLLGAYFLHETLEGNNPTFIPPASFLSSNRLLDQVTDSAAAYLNVEQDIGKLRLRAGARYTKERKEIDLTAVNYTPGADPMDFGQALSVTPYLVVKGANRSDHKVTWDVSAQYQFDPDNMVFARIAKGFKSSVYNAGVFTAADFSLAVPESITDYEIGAKTRWFDRKLDANLTAFYYDYRNYQIQLQLQTPGGFAFAYGNAKKASVYGAELEVTARPIEDLVLRAHAGFVESEFRDFANASIEPEINSGIPFNAKGARLLRSPDGTASISAEYTFRTGHGDLVVQTDWNYMGSVNYALWVDAPASQLNPQPGTRPILEAARNTLIEKSYVIGNARVAYRFGEQRNYEVSAWVKNITDEYYRTGRFSFSSFGSTVGFLCDPRTVGATVSFDY
jgi:iron complex outermembrane recepter protein